MHRDEIDMVSNRVVHSYRKYIVPEIIRRKRAGVILATNVRVPIGFLLAEPADTVHGGRSPAAGSRKVHDHSSLERRRWAKRAPI